MVPVNAQGDLANARNLVENLAGYGGRHAIEIVLLVNNFPPDSPPEAVEALRGGGARVVTIPNTRKAGEAIVFSARMAGIRAAGAEWVVNFDADCKIPNPTALLDWYVEQFRSGAQAAYTPVGHHDYDHALSVRAYFVIHHVARWIKRVILRIPTTRGSNYAVRRQVMLDLYDRSLLADDLNVGPTFKRLAGRVAYGGSRDLEVLTSGRVFRRGWRRIIPYFFYRLRYNLRVLPVRPGVARFTDRDRDSVARYQYGDHKPDTLDEG